MVDSQINLSISIVNTNNRELLISGLKSIYENTKTISFEIIVVDNCSTDGSVEKVNELYPDVISISNQTRKGFGFSQNRAFEQSKGRYFLVFNEDMVILPNALDKMIDRIKRDEAIGALGCRLLNTDGTLQHSCSYFPSIFSEIFKNLFPYHFLFPKSRFRSNMYYWDHDEERDVDAIKGCCMLIPRKIIEKIGLFDERFILFSDEIDLCKRIKQAGWKVLFSPSVEIIHHGRMTVDMMITESNRHYWESKIKYFKKHHGQFQAFIVRIVNLAGITLRILGWQIMRFVQYSKKQTANEKIKNYRKLYSFLFGLQKF